MDTSMDTDCADADSDDSTDTVVASCEMRRRWRERRQDHGTEARKLGRRIKQERFDAAENLSASQTEDAPAPQPEMFSRSDHAPADPPNWSETFAKRPIKVEPSFVPLYKVKLEHSRTMTDAADDVSWTPPAGGGGTCDTPPSARPDLNHPNSVMSGSDSDFDEPLSDDGSELEGFNDFLDGITRELNDGMYSDLRDGSFPKQEPSDQFSEPADHAKVKRETRCPSAQNLSADESHSGFDEPDGLDPSHEDQDKAADEAVDPPAASDVDDDEVGESDEHRDDVDPAADNLEEPTADTDVTEKPLQDSVAEQDAAQLETDEPSTDDLAESMDSSTSDVEDPPQESEANRTMEEAPLVETWEHPDGSQTAEATDPCLPRETELSNKETQEFEPQTVQTDNDDTTSDVPHEASYSQPTTCGTATPSSDEKDESQTVEEKTVVFPTVDQGIQVDDLSDGEIQDSPDDLSRIPAREQMSEMVDRDVQTDPPETSVASLQTTSPPPSQSSKKASEAAADKNAKHIDEYCEKTFWLLETFSDGLSKEDDCDKTRSVLDGAKQVRNGLNKRHGLPLSEQLNLCTTAVRSMLNALRKLSTRPPRKKPRTDGKVETKDKPTEIVPPFTTSGDRPRELSAGSSRTAVREQDSLRCTFSVRCSGTEPNTGSTADGVDDDPAGPAGEASSSAGARLKSAPSGRAATGDEASDISLWATTFFPTHKKRIIQDGYGRPFLDRLRDSAAVNSVYSTAFQRLAEKYQLVFKNSARLPDTVRKRMPSSDQWQEICSKRLKCELFTGFGIYLEEVADLQDEFLPLNPFRINLRPLKDGPAAGSEEGTPVADPMKPSLTPGGVRHSSGGGGSRAAEPADEVGHGPSKRDGHNLTSSAIASEMGGNAFGGVASGDGSAAAKVRQGSGGAQVSSGTAGKPVHVSDRVKHPSGEVAERTRNLSGGAPERTRQLSGGAAERSRQLSGGAAERSRQLSGGAAERSRQLSGGAPERTRQLSGGTPSERSRQPSGDTSVAVEQSSGGGPSDPATRSSGGISFKIRRSSGSIRHSSGGSGSTSGRITPNSRTGNVWEMECENFLDKIRPPGESPSKAPEVQDAPLPVTPEKAEEQNLPPSTPQNPTTSNPSRSRERTVPLRNQSFRCLIPIFRTNLNSSSASSSSKVSASAANVSAPAANVSASGVRVSASEGNLSASEAGGSASGADVSASDANVPASDANAMPSGASTPLQDEFDNVSLLSEGEIHDWSPSPQKGGMPAAERPSVSPARTGSCDVRDTDARHSARRILRDGLNLLDRQTMAPATASVKRPRQASGEGDSEARKRSRVRSVVKRRER
ncbi:uncharacterized protein LOC122368357 isoform X2 [Amphibalanus amphitrite]|uniref:uncharacterized protein LOC122368357 isoform X2 n=1 Tax=Amphibalanus amphitrite TaxID=1232801 RepID=UPI001C9215D4|nr:uncharacterized protein LOC122368357 isoform X2 [Amphibalanus amphitrite]